MGQAQCGGDRCCGNGDGNRRPLPPPDEDHDDTNDNNDNGNNRTTTPRGGITTSRAGTSSGNKSGNKDANGNGKRVTTTTTSTTRRTVTNDSQGKGTANHDFDDNNSNDNDNNDGNNDEWETDGKNSGGTRRKKKTIDGNGNGMEKSSSNDDITMEQRVDLPPLPKPMMGARAGYLSLCNLPRDLRAVKKLIELGADVNSQGDPQLDPAGVSPLMAAARGGNAEVVRYMITDAKANVELRDRRGATALAYACAAGHPTVVKLLLELGNARVTSHASDHAKGKSDILQILISHQRANPPTLATNRYDSRQPSIAIGSDTMSSSSSPRVDAGV